MANTKKKIPNEGRVHISPQRESDKAEPNCFIGINGVNYLIPKGKGSMVPPEVAEEFHRSQRAKDRYFATSDELIGKSQ